MVLLSIGGIGGADRTFACKSQECLWQDWYIFNVKNNIFLSRNAKITPHSSADNAFEKIWLSSYQDRIRFKGTNLTQTEVQYRCSGVQYILQVHCQWYSVCTAKAVYEHTAYILPSSCSVPVVYPAESEMCMRSIYCTSTALRSGYVTW